MEEALLNSLGNLGLNEKESQVYLACLTLGSSPVSKIARKARVNRITTYDILEKLKQKGLTNFYTKNKVKYFSATDIDIVFDDFEKKVFSLKGNLTKFKNLRPELNLPKMRLFEGVEGLKAVFFESLYSNNEILGILNFDLLRGIWPEFDVDYTKKRVKKNLFFRSIRHDERKVEILNDEDGRFYQETRIIPNAFGDTYAGVLVFDNKVALMSLKDDVIIQVMEDTHISGAQRVYFDMMWEVSKGQMGASNMESLKNSLLTPLSGVELHQSIEKMARPLTHDKKEVKDDNLSLF